MIALNIFLISFLLSYLGTLGLLKVRLKRRFVDIPNVRSSHEEPKPRFGGIAIVGSFYIAYIVLLLAVPDTHSYMPFSIGALLLFTVGVIDDWRGFPISVRFGVQVLSAGIVVISGGVIDHIHLPMAGTIGLGALSVPFTFLFIITCINFFNFIDGIDGLAAGSAFIAAAFLSLIASILGHIPLALVFLVMAGSALGFLQFNFPPARLFMGDSGSTFLGFFFAYFAIMGNRLAPVLPLFIPVLVLSSLFLDAGLTLVRRFLKGERIFDAHRTHYYQRLLSLGLNHKQVTILEYTLTVMLGLSAVIYFKAGGLFPAFLTVCWIVIFTALILKIRSLERGDRLFWEKRTLFVIAVDLLLITVSYIGAYFLRLNFKFTYPEGIAMLNAYPIVLVVRSACFFWFGLYRGVWKYTSTEDLIRIIKAVTAGSAIILTSVVLLYRFVAFPRSLFIIEYFLLIVAIGGARFAFRVFHEFGKEASGTGVERVAIIGAGDLGDRTAREIKNAEGSKINVVCFIDDDNGKIGLTLRGHPILGPLARIREICKEERIDKLVLAISNLPDEKLKNIVENAGELGIPLEGRAGSLSKREEPAVVLFDRLSKRLKREELIDRVAGDSLYDIGAFYKGKSVLIASGGSPVAPVLVRKLLDFEASVTVQVAAPTEAVEYSRLECDSVSVFIGGLDRPTDIVRLVDRSSPDVVFMCVALESPVVFGALNGEEYLWRQVVRGSEALVRNLDGWPVASLNVLAFWGGLKAGTTASYIGTAAEIIMMNAREIAMAAPTVVRFPRILTERSLRRIIDRRSGDALTERESFELLETEVVTTALVVAARCSKRSLLVPNASQQFSGGEVQRIFSNPAGTVGGESIISEKRMWSEVPIFPAEMLKPFWIRGLQEVMSPVFPASDRLFEAASRLAIASKPDTRKKALEVFSTELQEKVSSKL